MSSKKQTIVPFWVGKEAEIVREQLSHFLLQRLPILLQVITAM